MSKNNKKEVNWFLVAAIGYFISSILFFISDGNKILAIINLCLASCFFFLSISKFNPNKDKEKTSKEDIKKKE